MASPTVVPIPTRRLPVTSSAVVAAHAVRTVAAAAQPTVAEAEAVGGATGRSARLTSVSTARAPPPMRRTMPMSASR